MTLRETIIHFSYHDIKFRVWVQQPHAPDIRTTIFLLYCSADSNKINADRILSLDNVNAVEWVEGSIGEVIYKDWP